MKPMLPAEGRQRPLDGIRVLDLTRLLPGNYATQMLANFGADVIKVEAPEGDPSRWASPMNEEGSAYFALLNRNKRSLAIDLKKSEGPEALLRLIATADVLIESFRPGVMERLGLGPALLRSLYPGLIYCAITGFGQEGPDQQLPGHDLNYLARAGLLHFNRADETQPPTLPPTQIADLAGGALPAVIGILLALVGRAATGQGDMVDVGMMQGAFVLQPVALATMLSGIAPQPGAMPLQGSDPAYGIYQTRDGQYLTLAAREPKFWQRFCSITGRTDLIPQHGMAAIAHATEIRQEVAQIFAQRTRAEWLERLGGEDTCVAPVNTFEEAIADPQLVATHMLQPADFGNDRIAEALAPFPRLSRAAPPPDRPPPLLGEHGREVLLEAGFTGDEIAALVQQRVVLLHDAPH